MSGYTTREILDMIEANEGPEGLDLSGKDLSKIDLSDETVRAELDSLREERPEAQPLWWSDGYEGIDLCQADLNSAHLEGANLEGANLQSANLEGANLQFANLEGAYLFWANLQGASLWSAHLEEAYVERADLDEANLEGAFLSAANLEGASLQAAKLREADLEGAKPEGISLRFADLEGAKLRFADLSRVDLRDTMSIKGMYPHRAKLDHNQITRDQLGAALGDELDREWAEAKEAYVALKNNFKQIGRYDDASWAYRKERRMEKRESWQRAREALRDRHYRVAIGNCLKAASDHLVELVCDYGEGIGRVIGSLVVLWLVFAVSYAIIAGVWGPWQKTTTGEIRYVTRNPLDLLLFSIGVTSRMPAGLDARPILAMRILMAMEAVFGAVLAGLLGFVLGNRIRRS